MIETVLVALGGAGLGIVASLGIWRMGVRAVDATDREVAAVKQAGELAAKLATSDGKLLAAITSAETWQNRALDQQKRADALQSLLEDAAANLPADGARERMQAKWLAFHNAVPGAASAADKPVQVPAEPAASGSTDLLKPGE